MKKFQVIAALVFGLCFTNVASAQHFNDFRINTTAKVCQKACADKGGTWVPIATQDLPKNPVRVTSGADCVFKTQTLVLQPDTSVQFVRPERITFIFDHVDHVEFAMFIYHFGTWAAGSHARAGFVAHLNDYFPLTAHKLGPDKYKLNNLDFYMTLVGGEYDTVVPDPKTGQPVPAGKGYWLGVWISKETVENYMPDTAIDTKSDDPLKGLDED